MRLEEIKEILKDSESIAFGVPDGTLVPSHFHVTEIGKVVKDFIDCGGTVRHEEVVNFQLWEADDYDHRLHPDKLVSIIELSQRTLGIEDLPIEVEYQGETIGKYDLEYDGEIFQLVTKRTDCLAREKCGVPSEKEKYSLSVSNGISCSPGSGCC